MSYKPCSRHSFPGATSHPLPQRMLRILRIRQSTKPLAMAAAAAAAPLHAGGAAEAGEQPPRPAHVESLISAKYAELGIDAELYQNTQYTRHRQHVNPLKAELQVPAEPLAWGDAYADPARPLCLDIGCGYGRFLLALAKALPTHNMLGLEIRKAIVDRANVWSERMELGGRVRFVVGNATVSVEHMLESYPGQLDLVTILHPDPHFKKKHRKRRVVQPQLVAAVSKMLRPGGRLLLQSDVQALAEDMRDDFERYGGQSYRLSPRHAAPGATFFAPRAEVCTNPMRETVASRQQLLHLERNASSAAAAARERAGEGKGEEQEQEEAEEEEEEEGESWQSTWEAGGWLAENPLGVPTEREVYTLETGLPVYRVLLEKT